MTEQQNEQFACRQCGASYPHTTEYFYKTGRGNSLFPTCKQCYAVANKRRYTARVSQTTSDSSTATTAPVGRPRKNNTDNIETGSAECRRCKKNKDINEYYLNNNTGKRVKVCRACKSIENMARYKQTRQPTGKPPGRPRKFT